MLDHERLDVYQRAIEFLAIAFAVADRIPRGYASLADQLRRAAMSIPLNVAEASGKLDGPDRRRFHAVARGSGPWSVRRSSCDPPATRPESRRLAGRQSFARSRR